MNSPSRVSESTLSKTSADAQQPSARVSVCPVCSRREWEYAQKIRGAAISKCAHCGLLGTTDFLAGTATTRGIYETSPEHHTVYRNQYLFRRLPAYERVMPSLERFQETRRLLEIGCSYGYFLEIARRAGWHAEGVEISDFASEVARSKGFQIHQGELQTLPLERGSFDVIAMWDVIEHLTNPAEVVAVCADLLRGGGALVARTPNAHALALRGGLPGLAYRQLTYPANTPEHVFHFTPESLSSLLRKSGFEKVEIDDYGGWEERIISGRNAIVRMGRSLIMRYALFRRWPYEFVITGVKGQANS
jgi:2-polyprenyl-3-methyl-5-hydroxy-6-metoxy-1,4-benzoquinol methylase